MKKKKKKVKCGSTSVARLYLFEHDEGHGGQRGEEDGDDDHDDAHRDALVQAGESRDPPAEDQKKTFSTGDGETLTRICSMWSRSSSSPGAPAGDADALDHVDAELADVDEEEEEEAEGAVAPAEKEKKKRHQQQGGGPAPPGRVRAVPEGAVERPEPAHVGARREEQEPEDGQTKVHAAVDVHEEPGQAGHQVGQQRACVDYTEENRSE